jgi:two-component system, NtrC family, response regulator AtoC
MPDRREVLLVDDDKDVLDLLSDLLTESGYAVRRATNGERALASVEKTRPQLVIMDVQLPDQDGLTVLRALKRKHPELEVIVMTAFGGSSTAIQAIGEGAYDYVTKPFETDDLLATLRRVFERAEMAEEVANLSLELGKSAAKRERIVGSSRPMLEVYKVIGKVAASHATVMISGESGTGKELVAEAIHRASPRNAFPLVKVSCAALPETLLETELFGHERGSFTGAIAMRKGRFELANKGTIFLDEIGEMTLGTQTKLLRILQEREFERIGSNTPIKVDIRVIAASNRDLAEEVDRSRFREDLYYRLNVIHIHMPPLRERKEDIPALVEHFLMKYRWSQDAPPTTVTGDALAQLVAYDWPGNVRELENAVERAVVLSRGDPIAVEHLPFAEPVVKGGRRASAKGDKEAESATAIATPIATDGSSNGSLGATEVDDDGALVGATPSPFKRQVAELERRLILEALERAGGNRTRAAEELGIYRRLLYDKMREFGLGE